MSNEYTAAPGGNEVIFVPEGMDHLVLPLTPSYHSVQESYDESDDGFRPGGTRMASCRGVAVAPWAASAVRRALKEGVPAAPFLEAALAERRAWLAKEEEAHQTWLAGLETRGPDESWEDWDRRLEAASAQWWALRLYQDPARRQVVLDTIDRIRPAVTARAREIREEAWLKGLLEGTITPKAVAREGVMVVPDEIAETGPAVEHLRKQVLAAWPEIAARCEAAITPERREEAKADWARQCAQVEERKAQQARALARDRAVREAPEAGEGEKLARLEADRRRPGHLIGRAGGKVVFITGLPDWAGQGNLVAVSDWKDRGSTALGRFDGLRRPPARSSRRRR